MDIKRLLLEKEVIGKTFEKAHELAINNGFYIRFLQDRYRCFRFRDNNPNRINVYYKEGNVYQVRGWF